VALHSLVIGLLKNWQETTAYAGDEDFIFASDRLKGKRPRVPNMLVEDHLRPAAKQVIEIPRGHRFGFHNLRHALTSFLVDRNRPQNDSGHAALGRPFSPAQGLRALAKWTSAWRLKPR
jgi:integrase